MRSRSGSLGLEQDCKNILHVVVYVIDFVGHLAKAGMEIADEVDEGGITEVVSKLEKW